MILAKENSELNKVQEGIKSLSLLLNESPDFKEVILSPAVKKENKQSIISAIAE